MLEINSVHHTEIEECNIFGNGVCHINGMVVFVKDALPREKCSVKITRAFPSYAYAEKTDNASFSEDRALPCCDAYEACGGCCFLHTTLENENDIKRKYVLSTMKKRGIEIDVEDTICQAKEKYRNKVVLFVENNQYGYMQGGTNKIVPHVACKLNDDVFDQIASFSVKELSGSSLRAIYMRKSSQKTPEIMVCPIFYKPTDLFSYASSLISHFPNVKTILYSVYNDKDFALENVKFKTLYGDGYIFDELCGLRFRISPKSFYQVNPNCAKTLYEKAIELAQLSKGDVCADLFCGTGTIGIICAKKTGATVYGVEIVEDAVKDAKFNAKLNEIENISFEATDAKNFNKKVDTCIIDPPRKGCSSLMIETLLRLKPKRIVYVSCNPDTLARDIKSLLSDYKISSPLYPFNMFPRTSHVESVVCLTRRLDN